MAVGNPPGVGMVLVQSPVEVAHMDLEEDTVLEVVDTLVAVVDWVLEEIQS